MAGLLYDMSIYIYICLTHPVPSTAECRLNVIANQPHKQVKKVKPAVPLWSVGSSPCQGHWARRWTDHWVCDAWPVRCQTYGYLPSCRAWPPFDRYQIILLGDRGTWVWTTCPELLLGSGLAGSRTRDLSITSQHPNHWATQHAKSHKQVTKLNKHLSVKFWEIPLQIRRYRWL